MNLFRGIPGLARPTTEQPGGAAAPAGGLLPSQAPGGAGGLIGPTGSAGGSGFLSYLQSNQTAGVASPATASGRPESYEQGPAARSEEYGQRASSTAHDSGRAASDARETAAERSASERSAEERARKRDAARSEQQRKRDPSETDTANERSPRAAGEGDSREVQGRDARNASEAADKKPTREAQDKNKADSAGKGAAASANKAVEGESAHGQNEKDLALDGTKTVDRVVAGLPADLKETILSKNKGGAGQDQNKSDSEKSLVKGEGAASAKAVIARDAAAAVKVGNPETMNATELARFAERVAAAKSELQKKGDRREAQSGGEAPPGAREAKIDAASGGLRVELDSAKWQLNGRAYGERGGQDNTESRVAGLMDRYVKGRGANAKDSGERGNESGREQQRGDTRSFANRLSDLQIMNGGEVRDAGSQNPLDQARLNKEEVARENRRLFNDLVEKARVNVQSNGNSTASIKMNPAALGRMTLNLEVRQNQVHARILVDSDAAKRMLTDEMEHLRQELTRQGITVESLSIRVREPASMSFMEGGASSEQSTLEQPATGEEKSSDGSSGEAGRDGEDQSRRGSVDQAEQEYELAGAAASSERDPRRELSGVNISI